MSFSREQGELLRQLAQSLSSSLFVTLLAAFKLLLRRYSGQGDLLIHSCKYSSPYDNSFLFAADVFSKGAG